MPYVDGFVIPVPSDKIEAYRAMAETAAEVWKDHGALEYRECVGDDLQVQFGTSFPDGIQVKPGETVVFSWIVFESKEQRDKVNAAVMEDPRIKDSCDPNNMPFDCSRMLYGGFRTIVEG